MEIFQKSIVNKYLQSLDEIKVTSAYEKFLEFYGNKARIQNIILLKEENYQEGFLRELFVQVLGYTINPDENYNLTTEYKNLTDSKKADGAILKDGKAIGVIELKSTKTKDLDTIRQQAFNYKNNQPECKYVITSNFHFLRFYIDNATEYEEFDLFNLTENEFRKLFLILNKDNIFSDIPATLKQETQFHEEKITDKFYNDYSSFKHKIFNNLVKNNPQHDRLLLFKKSQKLLDRLLFIFFAEDAGLIPPNAISTIIDQWHQLKDLEAYQPLYDRYKLFFDHLNKGHKYKNFELPEYNGGLFADDEILNNVLIDDEVLEKDSLKLSAYDFSTEIDVNILGHIFEHSINEIEEISAQLEGKTTDKKQTKRKKEGIFYTPKYITQYIVENTIGSLCKEKKEQLNILEIGIDETHKKTDGKISKKGEKLYKVLNQYKDWLLTLKILDPACGSGAFLNQALDFLINEHKTNDSLINELTNLPLGLFDTDKAIIENNLYGVDINEESVEIAKLSLWLRTARKGRKLSMLSDNIKCGNSLIDDPEVAGDKAFDWYEEFPEIMENGGFDVVIGNPPYVRVEFISQKHVAYYKTKYLSSSGKFDLSSLFIEKSILILNPHGIYSIISSYQFLHTNSGVGLRKFLSNNAETKIQKFSSDSQVFEGATTYTGIFIFKRKKANHIKIDDVYTSSQNILISKSLRITNENFSNDKVIIADTSILDKLYSNPNVILGNQIGYAKTGVVTSADEIFFIKKLAISENKFESEIVYPIIGADELNKWHITNPETYCIYPYYEVNGKTTLLPFDEIKVKYPSIYQYLLLNKDILSKRSQGRKDYSESEKWYQLNRPREKWIYDSIKIIYPGTTNKPKFALDNKRQLFRNARVYAYVLKESENIDKYKFLLTILNSALTNYLISIKCPPKANGYFEMSTGFMESFPFMSPGDYSDFIVKANTMINLHQEFMKLQADFHKTITEEKNINKISTKLKIFFELTFEQFKKELRKQKIDFKIGDENNKWRDYFNSTTDKINQLKSEILKTEREIDQMVYELYGLTPEEIEIVEKAV